jgi:hypothetical protein
LNFSFLPRKIGHSGKVLMLKNFGHFEIFLFCPIIMGHLVNVEDVFHSCPKILGTLEISSCLKFFGQFGKFSA